MVQNMSELWLKFDFRVWLGGDVGWWWIWVW